MIVTLARAFLWMVGAAIVLSLMFGIWVALILDQTGVVVITGNPTPAVVLQIFVDLVLIALAIVVVDEF